MKGWQNFMKSIEVVAYGYVAEKQLWLRFSVEGQRTPFAWRCSHQRASPLFRPAREGGRSHSFEL